MRALALLLFLLSACTTKAQTITPDQAKDYVGKTVTVCGEVKSTHSTKKAAFMNFGEAYPNQTFTAVIFDSFQYNFPDLKNYNHKNICVTGKIELYKGKPEIVLRESKQIEAK